MSKEKDIRFYKTKERIIKAMIQLLEEKNFEQITVKDICKSAEVSRSGFYLHYLDKYDLVEKYQLEIMEHMNNTLRNISQTHITKEMLMLYMLNYLTNEGKLLALLISEHGSPEVQNQVKDIVKKNALENTLSHLNIEIETELEKKYFLAFFSNALFGVLQEWISSGQKESPEYLVKTLNKIINFDLI